METWGITEKILQDTTDVMYQVLMVNLFKHLIKCDPNTQRLGGGGREEPARQREDWEGMVS